MTGDPQADLAVPDRPFTFQEFLLAQAVGDGQVLAEHGRPVLRLHVNGRATWAPYAPCSPGVAREPPFETARRAPDPARTPMSR